MSDTLLILSSGVPVYSARGLLQRLQLIEDAGGELRRSINGELLDLSYAQFHKYKSTITCKDQRAPSIDGLWRGMEVTVSCVCELAYSAGGSPQRTVVTDSSYTENGFTFYRPVLDMRIKDIQTEFDEWPADVQWQIDLEEI